MPRTHHFTVLDSFRGLAALAIVILHAPWLAGGGPELFRLSEPFVLFFFVLSGFVLFHAHGRRPTGATAFGRFVATRGFRILPLHLCLLGLILLLDFTLPDAGPKLLANLLLLQAWLPGSEGLSMNPAADGLGIGFYLSLLFGLALLTLPRGREGACLLLAILALWGLLGGVDGLGRSLLLGVGGFCLGALSCALHHQLRLLPLGPGAFTLLEVTVLALLALILDSAYAHRELYAMALAALALFIFAFEGGLVSRLLDRGPLRSLGRWAFAIYLGHLAVFLALATLIPLLFGDGRPALLDSLLAPIAVLLVIALAALLHHGVERPGVALGRRLLAPRARARTAQAVKVSRASG